MVDEVLYKHYERRFQQLFTSIAARDRIVELFENKLQVTVRLIAICLLLHRVWTHVQRKMPHIVTIW